MSSPALVISERLQPAFEKVLGQKPDLKALVKPCLDKRFGDYQSAFAMGAAKERKINPREVATQVLALIDVSDICETPTIAGPGPMSMGFINFKLKVEYVTALLKEACVDERLGVGRVTSPIRTVLDFSSPNVAKQMHVGHIRSTFLGDALARIMRFLGHNVITDNHIGDWGTQFGMLIYGYKTFLDQAEFEKDPIKELERLYKKVNELQKADEPVRDAVRQELVKLQSGNEENLRLWTQFIEVSNVQFERVYKRLDVTFDYTLGESFYNPQIKGVVQELVNLNIAAPSEGALCVFFPDHPDLLEKPFLIQKTDGAALYATTDLATLRYRLEHFKAQKVLYITDMRQQLHFKQLFETSKKWGLKIDLEHVWFGAILGDDGKPIKTRDGQPVKLEALLDEAEERAMAVIKPDAPFTPEMKKEIARVIGIGSIKYADLNQNRTSDYVFSWDKMLSLQGNTAPYVMNAFARIQSIFRKGGEEVSADMLILKEEAEIGLALELLRFEEMLNLVLDDNRPNFLCQYLYELASKFHGFYEKCHVLNASETERRSRLVLCGLTSRTLKKGLELLGIQTVEQM